ncbi:MAG: hypothetical protein A2V70_02380 [Planctomycetes bacterium RBG_13_63_9]|nr:MAG: hypothetical protein A2V70_02380 [Planctomycetes bacterium RBG_13_63_9]
MPDPTVTGAAMRIVKLLVGRPPQTVSDLTKATGVTRTAVTEQLGELVGAGFVERRTQRLPGRGRPRHLYSATNTSLTVLFANNQHLVVPAVWAAIEELGGKAMVSKVLHRVSRTLAEHYQRRIVSNEPKERLRELIELLREEGVLVENIEEDGQLVLRKRSCPFVSMLDKNRSVCCIDQEMMTAVVGRPVRRIACRHDGDPCCTFEIVRDE